jgi:hypothetical protein
MPKDRPTGVLIIVENLPFPLVRRAMQEARALRDAGYRVSVISVKGAGCEKSYEVIEGIEVYRHRFWRPPVPPAIWWNTRSRSRPSFIWR